MTFKLRQFNYLGLTRNLQMGVSCILLWEPPSGLNPSQALEFLQKKLEGLGGKSLGAWSVDCETLSSTPTFAAGAPPKLIHMVHSSEYPKSTFAVLDNMNTLVADNALDSIFGQLKSFYAPRKGFKIDTKGHHFEVKQYVVKFGSIMIGSTNKGIVVEVEDSQNSRVSVCWAPLTDFTRGLLESSAALEPPNYTRQSDRAYTPVDRINSYTLIFNHLRKPPSSLPK